MEELEAVDWYNQRVDACKDPELKAIWGLLSGVMSINLYITFG